MYFLRSLVNDVLSFSPRVTFRSVVRTGRYILVISTSSTEKMATGERFEI